MQQNWCVKNNGVLETLVCVKRFGLRFRVRVETRVRFTGVCQKKKPLGVWIRVKVNGVC